MFTRESYPKISSVIEKFSEHDLSHPERICADLFKHDIIACRTESKIFRKKEKSNSKIKRFYFHSQFLIYHRYSSEYYLYTRSRILRVKNGQRVKKLANHHFNCDFYEWILSLR